MSKTYTTSTVSQSLPAVLSFTCPKCGQYSAINKKAILTAKATVRGYNNTASVAVAKENLAYSEYDQIGKIARELEIGNLNVLMNADHEHVNGKTVCSNCGLRQVVNGKKRMALYPKAFAGKVIGLFFATAFVSGIIVALLADSNAPRGLVTLVQFSAIFAVIAALLYNRIRCSRAYTHPELMEKRYHCVVNPHMEAVLMLDNGSSRKVDIPARE